MSPGWPQRSASRRRSRPSPSVLPGCVVADADREGVYSLVAIAGEAGTNRSVPYQESQDIAATLTAFQRQVGFARIAVVIETAHVENGKDAVGRGRDYPGRGRSIGAAAARVANPRGADERRAPGRYSGPGIGTGTPGSGAPSFLIHRL